MKKKNIIFAIICFLPLISHAQDSLKVLDALYSDFSVPDASAFSLLGITPNKVTRPASAKEVAASLLNIAANGSTISPGIAVEWAPGITFDKRFILKDSTHKLYADYNHYKSWKSLFGRNLLLSFATIQDSTGSKIALGLNFLLYDGSDFSRDATYTSQILSLTQAELNDNAKIPQLEAAFINDVKRPMLTALALDAGRNPTFWINHLDFEHDTTSAELLNIKNNIILALGRELTLDEDKQVNDMIENYKMAINTINTMVLKDKLSIQKAISQAKDDFKKSHWNAGMVKIGMGNIWYSPSFKWSGLTSQKYSGYISAATRIPGNNWLNKHTQFVGLLQYAYNYNDSSTDAGQFSIGGRALVGSNTVHGSIEYVYENNTYKSLGSEASKPPLNTARSTIGIEFRMNDGLWVEFATGVNGPSKDFWKSAGMLTFGSVKYTFKKESRFAMPL